MKFYPICKHWMNSAISNMSKMHFMDFLMCCDRIVRFEISLTTKLAGITKIFHILKSKNMQFSKKFIRAYISVSAFGNCVRTLKLDSSFRRIPPFKIFLRQVERFSKLRDFDDPLDFVGKMVALTVMNVS